MSTDTDVDNYKSTIRRARVEKLTVSRSYDFERCDDWWKVSAMQRVECELMMDEFFNCWDES